ncbi:hypothetical protein DICPUDRAFT_26975 [Dictyostelium purpureum]|uniref:C3H1-type domain-containing protein n=1 Tax=Dictyostelium purpureum TaxID=5786 RepID=F0Z9F8_DICPU|nr:uncharacterized protein DICPUDRAFT_26975 [Dictyostelium purpureum]EGC39403.1 hypothetical protein DICPUDRAFT_26975 [Dictyostelium purpureum]|eukprot:XP_003284077.1 hypothetical protein DICPUDRAFT_26975 [Dictyostelium purpureum]
MPPKQAASKKTVEKEKKKKIEDKTFGLKNKNKSKKVAAYVKTVETQVKNSALQNKDERRKMEAKKEKELQAQAKKDMELMAQQVAIVQPKVPLGVDPKSIVCEFFKHNQCSKGTRCKFSHDLAVQRKDAKIDIYTDRRNDKEADTMENWDDEKLKTVVEKKRSNENKNKTAIICKFFLDAIEQKKYGWFWECPNGGEKCSYQHCLPEGYQLKKKKSKEDEEQEELPIEEIIEQERAKLTKHTPVTFDTFMKWKEDKRIEKEKAAKAANDKRLADIKAGRTQMSGREMFTFNPEFFVDDDSAIDTNSTEYVKTQEEIDAIANGINKDLFVADEDDIPDISDEDEDEDEEDEDEDEEEGEEEEDEEEDDE